MAKQQYHVKYSWTRNGKRHTTNKTVAGNLALFNAVDSVLAHRHRLESVKRV